VSPGKNAGALFLFSRQPFRELGGQDEIVGSLGTNVEHISVGSPQAIIHPLQKSIAYVSKVELVIQQTVSCA
jgi:hypothetical protein